MTTIAGRTYDIAAPGPQEACPRIRLELAGCRAMFATNFEIGMSDYAAAIIERAPHFEIAQPRLQHLTA